MFSGCMKWTTTSICMLHAVVEPAFSGMEIARRQLIMTQFMRMSNARTDDLAALIMTLPISA